MRQILSVFIAVLAVSSTSFASSNTEGEAKAFNCMNKKTFEINSECISHNIESNLVFQKAEKAVLENIDNASNRALATMTFNPRTMTINIVAHKDATIAKVDIAELHIKK